MKHIFSILFCLSILKISVAQKTQSDKETEYNINFFRKATVSLGIDTLIAYEDRNGKIKHQRIFMAVGTGVCFYLTVKTGTIPVIVTAKHVFNDPQKKWQPNKLKVRFSAFDSLGVDKYYGFDLILKDSSGINYFPHPEMDVDLAGIIPLNLREENAKNYTQIPYGLFPDKFDYYEGKEIYTLGYPRGIGSDFMNRAILRKGIISWVPQPFSKPENGTILIDANTFPGNSGGPVFSITKNASVILTDTILQKPLFYGIVSQRRLSYNEIFNEKGEIVKDLEGKGLFGYESMGIGVIVSAVKVRELLDEFQKLINIIENK